MLSGNWYLQLLREMICMSDASFGRAREKIGAQFPEDPKAFRPESVETFQKF
jgi:hypothetical protein